MRSALPFLFALTLLSLQRVLLFTRAADDRQGLLPQFGGAPAVWTTCMVFFQVLLLAGVPLRASR